MCTRGDTVGLAAGSITVWLSLITVNVMMIAYNTTYVVVPGSILVRLRCRTSTMMFLVEYAAGMNVWRPHATYSPSSSKSSSDVTSLPSNEKS